MPLPPLPTLSDEADQDVKALWLYLGHLRDSLDSFTPSQVAAALNNGGLGTGPGTPLEGVTLPVSPPTPDTPVMDPPIGFYRQIVVSWAIDVNPFITGWEVQRADNLAFTTNVVTRTSAYALMFVDQDLGDVVTRYYRVRALTKDPANVSPFCAPQSATTLANDTGVITALNSAAVLIQRAHIHNLVVDSAKIADASILTAKIADLAVTTAKIASLAVTTAKIDDLGVTTAKIANLAVTNAKVNDLAADKLTAGTISVLVSLTNNTIKLDGINNQITITDTQGAPVVRVKIGKVGAAATDYGMIVYDAAGQVMFNTSDQGATQFGIKDLEVITQKLNDLAVATGKIANLAVTASGVYSSAAVGFTRDGTIDGTAYADTGASITYTTGAVANIPVEITAVCNMLVGSNTGAATLDRCIGSIKLVRGSTDRREAGYAVNNHGNAAAPNLIGPVALTFVETALSASTAYTWKIQGKAGNANSVTTIDIIDMRLREFKK